MTTRIPPSPNDHIMHITHSPNSCLSDRAGGLVTLPHTQDHPIVQSPNSGRESSVVGRQGFEPWKPAGDRFTVCSLCPLGYLPARVSREIQISAGCSLTTQRHANRRMPSEHHPWLNTKNTPALVPSGNRGWWRAPALSLWSRNDQFY